MLWKERFRNLLYLPRSGIETGMWVPPFQSKTGECPVKPAGGKKTLKQKVLKQKAFLLSQKLQLRKQKLLPQDAVDLACEYMATL